MRKGNVDLNTSKNGRMIRTHPDLSRGDSQKDPGPGFGDYASVRGCQKPIGRMLESFRRVVDGPHNNGVHSIQLCKASIVAHGYPLLWSSKNSGGFLEPVSLHEPLRIWKPQEERINWRHLDLSHHGLELGLFLEYRKDPVSREQASV